MSWPWRTLTLSILDHEIEQRRAAHARNLAAGKAETAQRQQDATHAAYWRRVDAGRSPLRASWKEDVKA